MNINESKSKSPLLIALWCPMSSPRCCWSWRHSQCHCSWCILASRTSTGGEGCRILEGRVNRDGAANCLCFAVVWGSNCNLSLCQWRLWEDVQRCDSPDQPHLHPNWFWHRHQSRPLRQGEAFGQVILSLSASPSLEMCNTRLWRVFPYSPGLYLFVGDADGWCFRNRRL